jgi:hypothetical protein
MRAVQERERVWMVWQDVYGLNFGSRETPVTPANTHVGYFKATSGYLYSKLPLAESFIHVRQSLSPPSA